MVWLLQFCGDQIERLTRHKAYTRCTNQRIYSIGHNRVITVMQ